jgi:hypothetical protein
MNACIVSFFKKYLTGIDDNLLDASSQALPRGPGLLPQIAVAAPS